MISEWGHRSSAEGASIEAPQAPRGEARGEAPQSLILYL